MTQSEILSMIVGDVMDRWPETVEIFHRRRMACPGCAMAPFMTVAEAARSYDLSERLFSEDLIATIGASARMETAS